MGQQQLLLIVIGIVLVGIAIVVGLNLADASIQNSNRDAVISDLNNIGLFALEYYRKPSAMGGGGNSFDGWSIPHNLTSNANGTYSASISPTSVTIVGIGVEIGNDGTNKVKATAIVTPNGITVTVNN